MLPEVGLICLILGFLTSGLLAYKPSVNLAYTVTGFVVLCFVILTYSFVIDDFSVKYVATTSSLDLPWMYKLTAVWGAHEGSMLLWLLILSGWLSAVAWSNSALPVKIKLGVLRVMGLIALGFSGFILFTSNPFLRLLPNVPVNGTDLNPLLQDPGFLWHPPLLYMGYVGFSVTFSLAIASLWAGKLDQDWARWSRPWALAAWCFLTAGIMSGSIWAYRVLGWGGWWFWDPVENASFMPWLVGTALVHSLIVTQKRDAFKAWTVFLAIAVFCLSLLGTFLVRSGVLTSVHAFALDPKRGLYMLLFLVSVITLSLLIYAWRAPKYKQVHDFGLLSRESILLFNNVFMAVAMVTVLLGTLYPLIMDALNMGKLSVGAPYFNTVFIPLMVPVLLLMGLGPYVYWQQGLFKTRLKWMTLVATTAGLLLVGLTKLPSLGLVGGFVGVWLLVMSLGKNNLSMRLAHCGVAICVIGVSISTGLSEQRDLRLLPGDTVKLGQYEITLKNITPRSAQNYQAERGEFQIVKQDKIIGTVYPEKRVFSSQNMALSIPGIHTTIWRDIYIALAEPLGNQAWAVRIYYKPLVRWIWAGACLIILGGFLALRRQRCATS